MAVQGVRERRHVLRRRNRRERDVDALSARPLEREVGRLRPVDDPEAAEDLGGEQEVRREAAKVRVVVARHERVDSLEDLGHGHALDRDHLVADQRAVDRIDDVQAVRKLVKP